MNLTKDMKDVYKGNYKLFKKEIEDGKVSHDYGLVEST
jgi:hypothetical protein